MFCIYLAEILTVSGLEWRERVGKRGRSSATVDMFDRLSSCPIEKGSKGT